MELQGMQLVVEMEARDTWLLVGHKRSTNGQEIYI